MNNPMQRMWAWLRQTKAMITPPGPELGFPSDTQRPELHCCPCGAGISRLQLKSGGILPKKGLTTVKAQIFCHGCGKQHLLQGNTPYHRSVVLILLDQPRRSVKRATIFRNGNVR